MALGIIFSAFFKAIGQMNDPRFRRVLLLGLGLTFALLVAAYVGFLALLNWVGAYALLQGWIGDAALSNGLINFGSLLLMMGLSIFLMVPVASAITSMFLDQVAQAVEDRHYPHLPQAPAVPFMDALRDTVNFMGLLVAANTVALLVSLVLLPFAPLIFWGVNGLLLGREYFILAAMRRVGRAEAKRLQRAHFPTIWAAGFLMAVPLSIPLLNLLVPILGAATFTQIFHLLEETPQDA